VSYNIKYINPSDHQSWDHYVINHPESTLYHLSGWEDVISKTYGHKTYYLMAEDSSKSADSIQNSAAVVGILPFVHIKHFIFGSSLISIPFFDLGGVLADNAEVEKTLIEEAIKLGKNLKVDNIELRHQKPLNLLSSDSLTPDLRHLSFSTSSHKVRMLLELPYSSDELMQSFKSKLRSQINKPVKEGLTGKIGGIELLNDFYRVFTVNMRDLGSPVHSKNLMRNVNECMNKEARIVVIYKDNEPVACSIVIGFKDTLENPWASSLRQFGQLSPNMLLYWTMLGYACDNGYKYFDFGRSTPDEGTYKFKEQWGAKPFPLHWQYIILNGKRSHEETHMKSKFNKAINCWQRLPVSITKIIGPRLRKYINL
jgi:serine/alanine adding enzyme